MGEMETRSGSASRPAGARPGLFRPGDTPFGLSPALIRLALMSPQLSGTSYVGGSTGKAANMTIHKSGGAQAGLMGAGGRNLLSMYAVGMVATTGALGVSSAYAQRGRGRGRGRGGGRGAAAVASARRSVSALVRPSSVVRSRRARRSGRIPSTIACSASGRTIPRAGPIGQRRLPPSLSVTGPTIACTSFKTPANCRGFVFFATVAPRCA